MNATSAFILWMRPSSTLLQVKHHKRFASASSYHITFVAFMGCSETEQKLSSICSINAIQTNEPVHEARYAVKQNNHQGVITTATTYA